MLALRRVERRVEPPGRRHHVEHVADRERACARSRRSAPPGSTLTPIRSRPDPAGEQIE